MTLADAMRKGAEQCPQGFWRLAALRVVTRGVGRPGHIVDGWQTCALGAAMQGFTGTAPHDTPDGPAFTRDVIEAFGREFRAILDTMTSCPQCRRLDMPAPEFPTRTIITHLNDEHRWTREQIADWLDEQPA